MALCPGVSTVSGCVKSISGAMCFPGTQFLSSGVKQQHVVPHTVHWLYNIVYVSGFILRYCIQFIKTLNISLTVSEPQTLGIRH